ncbi:derlin-1 isoform X1 [Diorhabda carinulata]|uniref:derlin-1 isoform X1 n=1 Tax=Diorhabda carinulata TaxID=1163345 RepID=UPI0025A04C10|nr:derlin-1 isoform X1 [Diorhabda carinulata]
MSDLGDWFRSIPVFTRYWFSGSIVFTLLGRFGIVNPYNLILLYEPLKKLQLWRLVTSVLYYPIQQAGFHYLINLYFLYNYSRRLEEGQFANKPADYLFMLLFNWSCCIILGLVAELPILMDPMILSVLYVWCQLNKDTIVSFWFGTRFKAIYLPWVLLGFNLVLSGGGIMELFGILVGHLYYFLMFKYPQELGGPTLLRTPSFLKALFPDQVGGVYGFGTAPQRPQGGGGGGRPAGGFFGGHNWGRGHTLGGN